MLSKIYLHNSSSDVSIEINSIVAGSIKYDKAISTSEELQFGGCIASQFQIEIYETLSEEYDELTYMQVDDSGEEHVIFDGIISNINTDNKVTSIIITYDRLSASVNVADWYEELFSTTDEILLSEMLNSLLTYLKYRFENVELTNDFSVKKTVLTNSLDSTSVIKWICELQGGFGYFNGNIFSIGYLSTSNPVTLDVLGGFKKDKVLTKPIDKVQIRNEEQDIGGIYGEGTNALIIQGNPLLFGKGAEELSTIAQNLYNTVKDIIYVPYEAQLPVGNASLDMFTQYTITSSNDNCLSYVLSTSLTGSQLCNQVIKAEGVERRAEAVKDVNKELYVLDYKTTRLKKDVDGFSLQIEQAKKDADTALTTVTTMSATVEGLTAEVKETRETLQSQGQQLSQNSTKIEQTSTYIDQSVVKNNEVITKINASKEGVKIKAKNIALEGLVTANENFKVLEDGSIEAVNGKFTGEVSTKSGFIGGWYISSNSLYTKKNIGDDIRLAYLQVPEDSLSSWIFSVQSEDLQGNRHGLWYVTANGDQTMNGSLTVGSNVSIGGHISVPTISGDTTVNGDLSVINDVIVGGQLSVNNGLTVSNNGSQAITIVNPDSEDLVGMYFFNKLGYLGNIYMQTVGGGLYRDGHLILDDASVVDNLLSTATDLPLSANMGRDINERLNAHSERFEVLYERSSFSVVKMGKIVRLVGAIELTNTTQAWNWIFDFRNIADKYKPLASRTIKDVSQSYKFELNRWGYVQTAESLPAGNYYFDVAWLIP